MKTIVLAEKPSVGKEIARVLGCHKKTKGFIEGKDYIVTWALGHLVTLANPDQYDPKYKKWRMEDLPMIPEKMKLKVIKSSSAQFRTVKTILARKDVKDLIIATDAGREGELVARWIMQYAHWKKPFSRLWISSQTDKAIKDGFKNLKPGRDYDPLFDAAQSRAEADWLIGLNISRALTCKYNDQLNAGRVQTPTLALMVEREKSIQSFKPKDFWKLFADFGNYQAEWRSSDGNNRIFDQRKAEELRKKFSNKKGTIKEVKKELKKKEHPLAYDLTELQRDANKKYGWSAQETLKTLQRLYEFHKIVTYPRTDSRYITDDIVPTLPERLKAMMAGPYRKEIDTILQKPLKADKRFVNNKRVSDHHAIIPTEEPLRMSKLGEDERMLYDLIARRFLEVLSPPYTYYSLTIVTEVEKTDFYTKAVQPKDLGWRKISGKNNEDDEADVIPVNAQLNKLKKGMDVKIESIETRKDQTKPPSRYTEATLLTAMESPGKFIEDEELRESIKSGGLGTPATRASIIEKLIKVNYIIRERKSLVPTEKGKQLITLVPDQLRSAELTAKWEKRLSLIATKKDSRKDFISGIRDNAQELVTNVKSSNIRYRSQPKAVHEKNNYSDRRNRRGERVDRKLMNKYKDNGKSGVSLGDLIKLKLKEK